MSLVVYKLRFKPPNKTSTISKNVEHIHYIGTRTGAYLNENSNHGLFGHIYSIPDIRNQEEISTVEKYIEQKCNDRTTIFRSTVSLREDDALQLGLRTSEDWERMIKERIDFISDRLGIEKNNLEWVASYHAEQGHPHIHICCWDKSEQIQTNYIKDIDKLANNIRVDFINDLFSYEKQQLYEKKQENQKIIIDSDILKDLKDIVNNINNTESLYKENNLCSSLFVEQIIPLHDIKFDINKLNDIVNHMIDVKHMINESKSVFKFEKLDNAIQDELLEISRKILEISPDCDKAFHEYIKCNVDIAKMYTTNDKKLDQISNKYEKEMLKKISNNILKSIKNINTNQKNNIYKYQNKYIFNNMIAEIFKGLFKENIQSHSQENFLKQELSQQAKREKSIEKKDVGLEWEN